MSGLFKQYKTDKTKEECGVKIEFEEAQNDDGSIPFFLVSRMGKGNKAYSKALEKATRPYRRQIELNTMNNEVAEEIFLKVFCSTVLVGWGNVQDENGDEIQFTVAAAEKLMKELPDVYERLQDEAKILSNFRAACLETEIKK